jgi:hypothetical protein
VFVALGIQQAMYLRRILVCGFPGCITPQYLINGTIFGKKSVIEHKICVLIFSTTLV